MFVELHLIYLRTEDTNVTSVCLEKKKMSSRNVLARIKDQISNGDLVSHICFNFSK